MTAPGRRNGSDGWAGSDAATGPDGPAASDGPTRERPTDDRAGVRVGEAVGEDAAPADLRTTMLGVAAWGAALTGLRLDGRANLALGTVLLVAVVGYAWRRGLRREHLAWLAVAGIGVALARAMAGRPLAR